MNRSYSISDDNGCIFCYKYYIPEEVLSIILSYVPPKDLVFTCRLVCKYWCNVTDSQVWRIKFGRENLPVSKVRDLPWFACYWMVLKNPFERNLVKNSCGEEGLKHWNLVSNQGDKWKVEKSPQGCGDFPNEASECKNKKVYLSCFATSYNSCSKEQIIDLKMEGAVPQLMDLLQPKITVSEWYCGRSDSRCIYEFKTAILDEHQNPIDEYEIRKNLDKPEDNPYFSKLWRRCQICMDIPFWAGFNVLERTFWKQNDRKLNNSQSALIKKDETTPCDLRSQNEFQALL